jgi:hypothetical protein
VITAIRLRWTRVSLLLAVLGMSCGIGRAAPEPVYNGHWWLSISTDQQDGFLNGYFDCYKYDHGGPYHFTRNPPDTARSLVTRFYEGNSAQLGMSVPEVFYRFRDLPGQTVTGHGGEPIKGRHGFYHGRYWGVLGQDGELGYVEGYLWCWKNCLHSKGATFSKSPSEYVALISKWYGLNPKTGLNVDRESAKIADVLYRFRDRNEKPSQPKK